jgi:hypothetical protein
MHPLELPSWLPHGVMEEILVSFKNILRKEINTMVCRQKPARHTQNLSIHSGFSIESMESTNSDASDKGLPPTMIEPSGP